MLHIRPGVDIPDYELVFLNVHASGPGGQHVNTQATAVELRFHIPSSSLDASIKERLLGIRDRRLSKDGTIRIVAQEFRSHQRNKAAAIERLCALLVAALAPRKKRRKTRPTRASVERRLTHKRQQAQRKARRQPPQGDE